MAHAISNEDSFMAKQRILIFSASAGFGHVRAANGVAAWAEQAFGDAVEVRHVDILKITNPFARFIYDRGFLLLVHKFPLLWRYVYNASNAPAGSWRMGLQRFYERLMFGRIFQEIKDFRPDHIVSTHFTPPGVLAKAIHTGALKVPVWVQVTDFDLHWSWLCPEVTGYFVASDEVANDLRHRGIPASKIRVVGIPIMPVFAMPPTREASAAELGIDPQQTTILLMSRGAGSSGTGALAERLLAMPNFQLIAVAGRSETALQELQALQGRYPGRLIPIGFTTTIERLMACSDLIITKSGGLTTSECLGMQLPMIAYAPIAGQEEANADYLMEHGAALKTSTPDGMEYRVRKLLENPARLAEMKANMATLGRPYAGRDLVQAILDYCG